MTDMTLEQADAVIRDCDLKLNDPDRLYSPDRAKWVDAKVEATTARRAATARQVAEESTATPEEERAAWQTARTQRRDLEAQSQDLRAELNALPEGHPRRGALVDELIRLAGDRMRLAGPQGVPTGLSFDIIQPPPPAPVVEPEPELVTLPQMARGERWSVPALREVDDLAEKENWLDSVPGVLHMVRHAHADARGWTAESTSAEWTRRHGPERAAELMAEATALEAHLKQSAPKFLAWVTSLGIQYDPDLLEHALKVRERPGQGAR